MEVKDFNIADNIISNEMGWRGGSLKVDVSDMFPDVSKPVMGCYQNYLGGGIAGKIVGAAMFMPDELSEADQVKFHELKERIVRYAFSLNNGGGDEWMQENHANLEFNQNLPTSGY